MKMKSNQQKFESLENTYSANEGLFKIMIQTLQKLKKRKQSLKEVTGTVNVNLANIFICIMTNTKEDQKFLKLKT